MKNLLFKAFVLLLIIGTSCSKEDSTEQSQLHQEDIKTITFRYENETYDVDFNVQNDQMVLQGQLPDALKDLQKDENLTLQVGQNNEILIVDNSQVEKTTNIFYRTENSFFGDEPAFYNFYKQFGLDEINHYGFVEENKDQAVQAYSNTLDLKHWYSPVLTQKQYYINGVPQDYTVDLIFSFYEGRQVEILEADPNQNNIFGDFLKNQSGLHHIGFSVNSLESMTQRFNESGYPTILTGEFKTRLGLVSKIAFFDTREDIGQYTELVEAKLLGFNVTQNQALLIFGILIGDAKLVCVD